jgi:hypothetical protein
MAAHFCMASFREVLEGGLGALEKLDGAADAVELQREDPLLGDLLEDHDVAPRVAERREGDVDRTAVDDMVVGEDDPGDADAVGQLVPGERG